MKLQKPVTNDSRGYGEKTQCIASTPGYRPGGYSRFKGTGMKEGFWGGGGVWGG